MLIIPTILEPTPEDFISQINKLSPYFQSFQIDIADGIYTPNKTIQIEEVLKIISNRQLAINNLIFDFHLMVKNYEAEIKKLTNWETKKLGKINNVLIHYSLRPPNSYLLTPNLAFSLGLVLNPDDYVEDLIANYDLKKIPVIQIMSVKLGYQGGKFIPQTLQKIEQLRLAGYRSKIVLDGGVNRKTLPIILNEKYRPDILAIGSYLTQAGDQLETHVNYLKSAIQ